MYFSRPAVQAQRDPGVRLEQSALNQRGWVFQERALSRRLLHFMGSQVYWECQSGIACQSGIVDDWEGIRLWHQDLQHPLAHMTLPSSLPLVFHPDDVCPDHVLFGCPTLPNHLSFGGPSLPGSTDSGPDEQHYADSEWHLLFHHYWEQTMCYYSTRALTFAGDRLAALQGVVERLEQRAGHWCDSEPCFVKSLAWAVHRPVDPPAALARAPSWSWLAQERHVYYPQEAHYLRGPWMHVDWPVFGRSYYGLRLVKPLPGPGCFTRGLEFRIAVTGLLAKGLRGEPLPDDIPWAVSTPAGNYVFAVRVGFYRSGDQTAWPDTADQRTFALLTPAAKVIIG